MAWDRLGESGTVDSGARVLEEGGVETLEWAWDGLEKSGRVDSGARVSEERGVETIEWAVREAIEEDILAEWTVMRP